jgi:hypothetical protein
MQKLAEIQSEIGPPALKRIHTALARDPHAEANTVPGRASAHHTCVLFACVFEIIDFTAVFRHLPNGGRDYFGRMTMKRIHELTAVSAIAFSTFALANISGSAAYAGPAVPAGHYCMTFDTGGSDCGFTSYEQCLATASGIDAECYGKTARDDGDDRNQWRRSNAWALPR